MFKTKYDYDESAYDEIYRHVFHKGYPGYIPSVIESPNGDHIWDLDKRYAHIAKKYLDDFTSDNISQLAFLDSVLNDAKLISNKICQHLNIPKKYWGGDDCTMRILDYPPGATTAPHTDFDMFTITLYRNTPDAFKYLDGEDDPLLKEARTHSCGIHLGELMTEITGAKATKHEVIATNNMQKSIVFFVVPDHKVILPSGISVGDWMKERKERSRKEK